MWRLCVGAPDGGVSAGFGDGCSGGAADGGRAGLGMVNVQDGLRMVELMVLGVLGGGVSASDCRSPSQKSPWASTRHVQSKHSARPNIAATCWYHINFGAKARRCIPRFSVISRQSKRASVKFSAANPPGSSSPARTIYVCDQRSCRRCLGDSGAQLSVISATEAELRLPKWGFLPQAVNISPTVTFRICSFSLDTGL
ncbi:hypothetical protein SprV_0602099600 [Sparganum proliferum]